MSDARDAGAMLITLTADIVSAHVANNSVSVEGLPRLIESVHAALDGLGAPPAEPEAPPTPAVSIRASVRPDYLVCLEDGKKLKMLRRYLMTHYQMTPEDYRARWNLPADYPMVAPAYSGKRRTLAKAIGLGRKSGSQAEASAPKPVKKAPARKKLSIAV